MMISQEQADRILHQILNKELLPTSTRWHETFGAMGSETEMIGRGLDALYDKVTSNAECVLHGWIDQAVLEIVSVGRLLDLRERAINYRADQGGDTGVLALEGRTAYVLDFSFDSGTATLREYNEAEQ